MTSVGRALALAVTLAAGLKTGPAPGAKATDAAPLVDAQTKVPTARLDIRYATAANLAGRPLYPVARCLLRPEVASMLARAQSELARRAPGMALLLLDCYRPHSAQRHLYAAVRGTPRARYVSNPDGATGSVHSYGAAVDLTLVDAAGREVDMGTPYDFLGPLAEPRHEAAAAAGGTLPPTALAHRRLLRDAMVAAGFRPISNEWWHFDALRGAALRRRYRRLDIGMGLPGEKPTVPFPPAQEHQGRL